MIRNKKNKLLTLLVAGVIGTAAFGGGLMTSYSAKAADTTYSTTDIFTTSQASLSKDGSGESGELKMVISHDGRVSYTNDLALKWYEKAPDSHKGVEKYMNMDFSFSTLNFDKVIFAFETASLIATKDNKAVNKVVFKNAGDNKVEVSVNGSEESTVFEAALNQRFKLSLANIDSNKAEINDSFDVMLKAVDDNKEPVRIGAFKDIATNYAEYDTGSKIYSFYVTADMGANSETQDATLLLYEINGQELKVDGENNFVGDNKAPVLVVNEDIDGFVLGTAFALDYKSIDVLDRKADTAKKKELKYYQYDPDDAVADTEGKGPEYKELSTDTYFQETNYTYTYDDNGTAKTESTTVYSASGGYEYVSIKFTLSDNDENKYDYFLDWYLEKARENVKADKAGEIKGFTEKAGYTEGIDYIKVYANNKEDGAKYTFLEAKNGSNTKTDETPLNDFKTALKALEREGGKEDGKLLISAGEGAYVNLPSMKGLFVDNGGYSNLEFTISYKTTTNNSAKTSSGLRASSLRFEVTEAGLYEFKVFAKDKAGNNMRYYLDGELVDVTAANIWSIEEIPSFSVRVAHNGLTVEDEGSKKNGTEVLYGTYDIPKFNLIGSPNVSTEYALFYIDLSKVGNTPGGKFYEVSYAGIAIRAETLKRDVEVTERGLELYKLAYAMEVISTNDPAEARTFIAEAFKQIDEYNSKINKDLHPEEWKNSDNDYAWKPNSRTFAPQKTGVYLVLACFTDPDVAAYDAGAYIVVNVDAKADIIKGETQWLKNNMVSVILFSIAGVMLILIIILLVVKPSDETLEDYDEPKAEKVKKSKKQKANEKSLEELDKE